MAPAMPPPPPLSEVLALIRAWLDRPYPRWRTARLEADVGEPERLVLPIPRANVSPDTPPDS